MNLPFPFESARDIRPDAFGRVALVDTNRVTLAHLPLEAAYEITPERNSPGYGFGFDDGFGGGYGYGLGSGNGFGDGEGRGK